MPDNDKKAKRVRKVKRVKRKSEEASGSWKDVEEERETKKKSPLFTVIDTVVYVAVVILVTFLIITFVGQRTNVSGESMENTLQDGDQLIVDKLTYRFRDPSRFDIIVFPYKGSEDTYYIKRIIGLPGETVQIIDGYVYIDGELLEDPYGREVMDDAGIAADPITLGEDEYFVLGDNRNASSDSRNPNVGLISRDDIIGRAWVRIWPLKSFGILKHS